LRILGKGATSLPGKIALWLCPTLLRELAGDVKTIVITGTNGKTTSTRMTEAALYNAGLGVFSNKSGANLIEGITAAFVMNTNLRMKPKKPWAVIECDEAAAQRVLAELKPEAVLITNLFKDQSDRYGNEKAPMEMIYRGLKACPDAALAVNADSQLVSYISERLNNKALYFGMEGRHGRSPDQTEENRCARCGKKLIFSSVSYSNLGDWHCSACGRVRSTPSVLVRDISEGEILAEIEGKPHIISSALPAAYNAFNAAGVIAVTLAAGISAEYGIAAIEHFERGFGRMEKLNLGKLGAEMILVKNTAAVNQTLDYIKTIDGAKTLVFIQNARAGDGRDLSWLNDADFEKLRRIRGIDRIFAAGDCGNALTERIKKTGIKCEAFPDYDALINMLNNCESRIFLLPSYTAMLELHEKLIKRYGGKSFWE